MKNTILLFFVALLSGCATPNKPIKMNTPNDWCSDQKGVNGPVQSPKCGPLPMIGDDTSKKAEISEMKG